jgi:hypothetical protein
MTAASSSKAAVFRAIAQARRSTKRYQIDREIPAETLTDILQSAIVSIVYCIIDYRSLLCVPVDVMAFQRETSCQGFIVS